MQKLPIPQNADATPAEKLEWINANKSVLRKLLQLYGTEYRRAQNPDYWVLQMEEWLDRGTAAVVIPDIRYENEGDMIRRRGGRVWLVERPGPAAAVHEDHTSEQFCRSSYAWDVSINNHGDLQYLEQLVDSHYDQSDAVNLTV